MLHLGQLGKQIFPVCTQIVALLSETVQRLAPAVGRQGTSIITSCSRPRKRESKLSLRQPSLERCNESVAAGTTGEPSRIRISSAVSSSAFPNDAGHEDRYSRHGDVSRAARSIRTSRTCDVVSSSPATCQRRFSYPHPRRTCVPSSATSGLQRTSRV